MRVYFDQKWNEWEKKRAVNQAVNQAVEQAVEQTTEKNVVSAVKTFVNEGDDEASIITKLISIFGLSKDQAEAYYHSTLNPA